MHERITRILLAVLFAVAASPAWAQSPPARDGLTVEEVNRGWVLAPDFKLTRVDGVDTPLVGAFGGTLVDRRFLVGGGGYFSTAPGVGMSYGGGLVEWFGNPGGLVDFSVRGFVGLGRATLDGCGDFGMFDNGMFPEPGLDIGLDFGMPGGFDPCFGSMPDDFYPDDMLPGDALDLDDLDLFHGDLDFGMFDGFGLQQNFFLAEPQASVHLNLSRWLRISGGAGYRLVGRAGGFADRLRGLTTSIGMQIGPR